MLASRMTGNSDLRPNASKTPNGNEKMMPTTVNKKVSNNPPQRLVPTIGIIPSSGEKPRVSKIKIGKEMIQPKITMRLNATGFVRPIPQPITPTTVKMMSHLRGSSPNGKSVSKAGNASKRTVAKYDLRAQIESELP